jgi:hypothetical protein
MKEQFETQDFYASAYLLAEGIPLCGAARKGNLTVFSFNYNEKLEPLLKKFYAWTARVDAAKYASAIKTLKNLIHNNKYEASMK